MVPATELLTYNACSALPEINRGYEVLDGKLIMFPAPTPIRQRIVIKLSLKLIPFVQEHLLGEVDCGPVDVLISREPLRPRLPDVMFIHGDRGESIGENLTEGTPDLVKEILSHHDPSTGGGGTGGRRGHRCEPMLACLSRRPNHQGVASNQ